MDNYSKMRLSRDFILPPEKLGRYLLVKRVRNDKSQYLALAGFTAENETLLETAIRDLVANNDAVLQRHTEHGDVWEVTGVLAGPVRSLAAVVILLLRDEDGRLYFVTLYPGSP